MDYYGILGVSKSASQDEIKKAYRKLAMEHHPDKGGDVTKFQEITNAYETLSDPVKRAGYDSPPQFKFDTGFAQENPFGAAGAPFENMFTFHFGNRTARNRDITISATVNLEDIITGKELFVQYRLHNGDLETVTVNIPPGARPGDTIRYHGLGDKSNVNLARGDLLVRIQITPHTDWVRDHNNLMTKKSINVFDLLLGCAIMIETLDKRTVKVTIPRGTRPGTIFSISGYGIPDLHTKRRGNLYVQVDAEMPVIEDAESIKKIEELKQLTNKD